jgi:lipopolysaccharide transport system ATP-binding protein
MSDLAIKVDRLSKQYQIGLKAARHDTLRDHLVGAMSSLFQRNGKSAERLDRFWALKDVSFDVQRGEAIGLIGRNGAGKSTFLKILSRITEPTSGFAEIRGRVASLLEVGTGFHGELTGRENIYLNGAILGMKHAEINRKFDEIVAFSEVEKFIDTPVKRYSSGMYVRLAFAVAAHLEPEILIVDEVLAVGDYEFQKKCLGKMDNVAKTGRTVLYVSHSMESIMRLCTRVILMENGKIARDGDPNDVVQDYLGRGTTGTVSLFKQAVPAKPNQDAWISRVELLDDSGVRRESFVTGEPMRFRISFELLHPCSYVEVGLALTNQKGVEVAAPNSMQQFGLIRGDVGTNTIECRWDGPPLTNKRYHLRVDVGDYHRNLDSVENAVVFQVEAADYFGTGRFPNPNLAVLSKCSWQRLDKEASA